MLPLAFFWDIENCQVPVQKSTFAVVQRLRERFGDNFAEVEFVVVCDVIKERPDVVEDLNAAQATVIHVNSLAKNACDDKLRTSIMKFSMLYSAPGVVVLISSDVNFAQALTDLRYRCGFRIVLLHNENVSNTLLLTANEHYDWQNDVLAGLPDRPTLSTPNSSSKLHKISVGNLPHVEEYKIRDRLRQLSDNCGGRVLHVDLVTKTAIIGFVTPESAMRAQKRINGSDVFGKRISVRLLSSTPGRPINRASVAAATLSPQISRRPETVSYIGRSTILHHFTFAPANREAVGTSADRRLSETLERSSIGSEDIEEVTETTENPTSIENDMKSAGGYSAETNRLKRVLGFVNQGTVADSGGMEDDDGLDFTPVKIAVGTVSDEHLRTERRSRQSSTSQQILSSGEKAPSRVRLLDRFAREAVELLRASPLCRVLLPRFSSVFCGHFNRPLRLAEFGCSKLTELLGEVRDTLQIVEEPQKDKWVTLVPALLKSSLQDQIISILRQQPFRCAPVERLIELYELNFGCALNFQVFGFESMEDVLSNMREVAELEILDNGVRVVKLLEYRHRQMLSNQLLYMFIRCPERRLASWQLENEFRSEFGVDVSLDDVKNYLSDLVQITEHNPDTVFIELDRIQRLALRLRHILVLSGGELPLSELEQIYQMQYGERIFLADDNGEKKSVVSILRSASHVLYLKGRGNCNVSINRNFLSSLKDLKPDLFIPPEAPKFKKRSSVLSARSISTPGFGTYENSSTPYRGNRLNVSFADKPGYPTRTRVAPVPSRPCAMKIEKSASPASTDDDIISAASTPPDPSGLDGENRQSSPGLCTAGANVVLAGSGELRFPQTKFSVPALPVHSSFVQSRFESTVKSEPITPAVQSPVRRSRLAVNFAALPKIE